MEQYINEFFIAIITSFVGLFIWLIKRVSTIEAELYEKLNDQNIHLNKRITNLEGLTNDKFVRRDEFKQIIETLHKDLRDIKDLLYRVLVKEEK